MQRTRDLEASAEALTWLRSKLSWELRLEELRNRSHGDDELVARRAA
jgi:hypothetical protein